MKNEISAHSEDIHLLTTDVLLDRLVGGEELNTHNGDKLSASSEDTRNVLNWYRTNVSKWAGNLTAGDTEAIIDTIGKALPIPPAASETFPSKKIQVIRLKRLVAHRFGGLHVYGHPTTPPDDFIFEPAKDLTLFEGANGSGKTSIANAIIWCLTGSLIRSQREPETGQNEFACDIEKSDSTTSYHQMSAVTPLPHSEEESLRQGEPVPADTWVELTFVDQEGYELPPLKRLQSRTAKGKLTEIAPDFNLIDVPPISWRIATIMPALLPYLSVGSSSQLGQAVARLTGLADLVDMAKHATKAHDRIIKKSCKELANGREQIAIYYDNAKSDVKTVLNEHTSLRFDGNFPSIESDTAKAELESISKRFHVLKNEAMSEARSVLGESFDAEDKSSRDDLERNIQPAIQQVRNIAQLPSILRLSKLRLSESSLENIIELRSKIIKEAKVLSDLTSNPERASRDQLYARVSAWMHENEYAALDTCPVCTRNMSDAVDPHSGEAVIKHLESISENRDLISKTLEQWSLHWVGGLVRSLPADITPEAKRDLPPSPTNLIKTSFLTELFKTEGFKGILSPLRKNMENFLSKYSSNLTEYEEPTPHDFPTNILSDVAELPQVLTRIDRLIAFAEWRTKNSASIREIILLLRETVSDGNTANRSLGQLLNSLKEIVDGVAPLNQATLFVSRMEGFRKQYSDSLSRTEHCERAAQSLKEIVPLGQLAEAQVSELQKVLHDRSEYWCQTMYRNATQFAPKLTETRMNAKGVLELQVGRKGVSAPAQHISNASALRGALLGFFLAFREYVLKERGGLTTLVLDDPQELLDNDNRERLARGISKLTSSGAQTLVTTHDRQFARCLVAEHRGSDLAQHLSVHPVNVIRPTLVYAPAIEEVDRKKQTFQKNIDDHSAAQDYAADLRVFMESRLGDLFDNVAHPAYSTTTKALTLFQLLDRLRSLMSSSPSELFQHPVIKHFLDDPSLSEGHDVRRTLNQSHHDKASITYADVDAVAADFQRLRTTIDKVHEQFRLHRWREPIATEETATSNLEVLQPLLRPAFSVHIYPDIAAFTDTSTTGPSQDADFEMLDESWFDNKSLYYIRSDSLGFAIPSGAVAIVESEPYPGRDQDLVIAHYIDKVYARRLIKPHGTIGVSLTAQVPNPIQSRPSITSDLSKLRIHRIVGAIFTDMPPPAGKGEATFIREVPELSQITVGYRVREQSAIPVALPKQTILGGQEIASTNLEAMRGKLVALTLNDGTNLFKRVGAPLPGKLSYLRHFETIGGLGASQVIATNNDDDISDGLPLIATARHVLAVLYV
ncbi:AAA family ATPase [Thalassospira alkalitolerans]|uniref:AAA family ATPase n=1 Tax=Thalassospira alkalitolerans TaxID=1293890 RepID=UPI0030EE6E3E|tara:strand:+ start:42575 stop:46489 length:3915 start_codon:yes stop_codon:yes gene_type:complete